MIGLVKVQAEHTPATHRTTLFAWSSRWGWEIAVGFSICFWLIVGALFALS